MSAVKPVPNKYRRRHNVKMQCVILFVLVGVASVALADGQFYVPRAYYTIDAEGHASAPVPLRRLRRSLNPYPYAYGGANANADANANANAGGGGDASANARANANAFVGTGGWALPRGDGYGASNPNLLSVGSTRRQFGPVLGGHSVSAGSTVDLDASGKGYYDQYASVGN